MSAAVLDGVDAGAVATGLAQLHAQVDALLVAELTPIPGDELLTVLREAERLRNRLAALDHRVVAQVERLGLAQAKGYRDTATLLSSMLRVNRKEAFARMRAAAECGPRISFQGETLPADHPEVAAEQAAGTVSAEQARIITTTVDALPGHVTVEAAATIRDILLGLARVAGPEVVGKAARHALVVAEQDGAPPEIDERRRERRGVTLFARSDGSARVTGELTAECCEVLQTLFDAQAAPKAAADGVRDARTGAQRRHDALLDAMTTLLRAGQVPDTGGVSTTVVLTLDHTAWLTGYGVPTTAHGGVITAREAVQWAGGDANVVAVALDSMVGVTALSGEHRIFTKRQRRAMAARDQGCTFPGCTAPPGWCEAHHATDYAQTGWTSVEDGGLVCGYDHRERIREQWTTKMINGQLWWIPPPWIDPSRTPVRNTIHDLPSTA